MTEEKDWDRTRDMLNRYPSPGVVFAGDVTKYYTGKKFLSVEQMALRMKLINEYLGIFFKLNTVEEWTKEIFRTIKILKICPDYYENSAVQTGILKFFPDHSFKGCIRVFADIGTIMDSRLVETKGGE